MALNKLQSFLLSVPFFEFTSIGKKWIKKEEEILKQFLQKLKGSHFTFKSVLTGTPQRERGAIGYFLVNRDGIPEQFALYFGKPIGLPINPTYCCYSFVDGRHIFNKERFMLFFNLCKRFDKERVTFSVHGADSIKTLLEDEDRLIDATLSYTDPETKEQITIYL